MGILDKLNNDGSNLTRHDGSTPPTMKGASPQSTLQDTYSINGIPDHPGQVPPSTLDLDGLTPPRYLDNLPE